MKIKGVILAGGKGTRLMPLTKVTNKHLLPISGKPMLQHSVEKLVEAGITDIMIVTGGEHLGDIAEFCGSGRDFGCEFTYRVQDEAGGIAEALDLARGFVREGEHMCVVLGDNIFEDSLERPVDAYSAQGGGAMVMVTEVHDPNRFGVAEVEAFIDKSVWKSESEESKPVKEKGDWFKWSHDTTTFWVTGIEEKPDNPKTNFAVTGIYFYDHSVFRIIEKLERSARGELEITDVNNGYAGKGLLACEFWRGWWTDAGTPQSYRKANELVEWAPDELAD